MVLKFAVARVLKLCLFLSFIAVQVSLAQGSYTVQGIVTDSLTKEALVGASITIVGTSQGAATNLDGEYKIQNIPPN